MTTQHQPVTPTERDRVRNQTADEVQAAVDRESAQRIEAVSKAGPDAISARLRELDAESDIERFLEVNASALAFVGVVLGATVNRRWLLLPAAVTAFLFQHGVQGWCPPIPVLRRFGVRTRHEIEAERYALKALRGDFDGVSGAGGDAGEAIAALEAIRA